MPKAMVWLFVLVFFMGCASTIPQPDSLQEVPDATSVPPIKLSEYIIGPGDVLQIQVWRHADFSSSVKVPSNGVITFPLIGDIMVSDVSLSEFRSIFTQRLDKYIVDPQVNIQVASAVSNKIYILGEVRKPGVYGLEEPKTISEAIVLAGGFTYNSSPDKVVFVRKGADGAGKPVALDMQAIMNGKAPEKDIYLQRGDVIYVPLSTASLADRFFNHLNLALSGVLGSQQLVINYPALENVTSGDYKDTDQNTNQTIIVPIQQP